jgi:hypothetical protein
MHSPYVSRREKGGGGFRGEANANDTKTRGFLTYFCTIILAIPSSLSKPLPLPLFAAKGNFKKTLGGNKTAAVICVISRRDVRHVTGMVRIT